MPKFIDLNDARTSTGAKVFAGRERGAYWRDKFKIAALDTEPGEITVRIPEDVISLNISFFLSLFGESVRTLGKERFRKHYVFECEAVLWPLIDQGVEQALKRSTGLSV